jgi:transcriptional regulator with XRE-family HTH domain
VPPLLSREALQAIFGASVKAQRLALQMRQESLAEAVGYGNQAIIAKIEGGVALPSFDKAVAIAQVLGISLDSLLRGESPRGEVGLGEVQQFLQSTPALPQGAVITLLRALANNLER